MLHIKLNLATLLIKLLSDTLLQVNPSALTATLELVGPDRGTKQRLTWLDLLS